MNSLKNWSEYLQESGLGLYRDARLPKPVTALAQQVPKLAAAVSIENSSPAPAKIMATTATAIPASAQPSGSGTSAPTETLADIRQDLGNCQRCKLGATRKNVVFGEGNPRARLMFIGEGPGADEDQTGRPFVGKAGQLLDKMIAAMGLKRDDVYIANIVKSRPPNNRDPEPEEIAACFPFLQRQIRAIAPEVIVTLGKPAARTLLKLDGPISVYRGVWQRYEGIEALPTFHPAYLLRNPADKRHAWADLQAVMRRLGLQITSGE